MEITAETLRRRVLRMRSALVPDNDSGTKRLARRGGGGNQCPTTVLGVDQRCSSDARRHGVAAVNHHGND